MTPDERRNDRVALSMIGLQSLAVQRRDPNEEWAVLPEMSKRFFTRVIGENTAAAALGRVILVGQLYFLFSLDAPWTHANLLPLLDWSLDRQRAAQAWHGFLTWGRWDTRLLASLMPLYEQAFDFQDELGELSERFASHLADITVFGDRQPNEESWLGRFLSKAGEENKKRFAAHLRHLLRSLSDDAKSSLWQRWMNDYWRQRILGIPPLSPGEAEVMAEWLVLLGPVFASAVDRFCETPVPPLLHTGVYRDLRENGYATSHAASVAKVLEHTLPGAALPFLHCDDAAALVQGLIGAGVDPVVVRRIRNELGRLGCQQASELPEGV